MWAGSRFEWHSPICVGDTIERTSSVQSVQHKVGKSGDLVFVKVLHELRNGAQLCLSEEHDIVYKSAPLENEVAAQPTPAAKLLVPELALWQREVVPDDVLLFRYSALTFNGHRIHYDRTYVTQQEGYPGLVVHGPLIATLLVDLLRRNTNKSLKKFEFKAVRPSFECADGRAIHLSAQSKDNKHVSLWAQDHEAYLTMQATAELN
jgi:3-methylfumaryl-CoA hydratase